MWEENAEKYKAAIKKSGRFELKGKSMLYTSSNGYMFSQLNKAGEIGIRLSKDDQKEFKEKYNATEFKSYGATMRDYVKVPDELLGDVSLLANWMDKGFDFVNSLEPK